MFKRLIIASLLAIVFLFAGENVSAVDLTVICPNGSSGSGTFCTVTPPASALFGESNLIPGDTITRTLTVTNHDVDESCNLNLNINSSSINPVGFDSQLNTKVGGFDNTFAELFSQGNLLLGSIAPNSTAVFPWLATFNRNAGNAYQGANIQFNFNLGFSCSGPGGGGGTGGGVLSAAGPPNCDSTTPATAPFLQVVSTGPNSANLSWTSVTPVSHYVIRYGFLPGNYIYGAPNVGNVTSFTVNQLSAGQNFYFQVAGVNGCAPGPWSNQSTILPTGQLLPLVPAPGFVEGTLGTSTEVSPSPSGSPSPTPGTLGTESVQGASSCTDTDYPWWLPLVIQLLLGGGYVIYVKRREEVNFIDLWPLVVFAIISQAVHEVLGCNCATLEWCQRYWILNLIVLGISVSPYFMMSNEARDQKIVKKK